MIYCTLLTAVTRYWEAFRASILVTGRWDGGNYRVQGFAYWKEGGLESPMPPVLSAGGGGRGGGGGEGWAVVSTGGTTATGGSAAGASEDTSWKKGIKADLDGENGKETTVEQRKDVKNGEREKERNRKVVWGEGSR